MGVAVVVAVVGAVAVAVMFLMIVFALSKSFLERTKINFISCGTSILSLGCKVFTTSPTRFLMGSADAILSVKLC